MFKLTRRSGALAGTLALALVFPLGFASVAYADTSAESAPATVEQIVVSTTDPEKEPAAEPAPKAEPEPAPAPAETEKEKAEEPKETKAEPDTKPEADSKTDVVDEAAEDNESAKTNTQKVVSGSDKTNDPSHWESVYKAYGAVCYKDDSPKSGTDHGYVSGKRVVLNAYGSGWYGDGYVALIVKGGDDYAVYEFPIAGTGTNYVSPLNNGGNVPDVSHWIVCKGDVPETPKPTATLKGDAKCEVNGTWTVTWTGTLANYGSLSEVDIKVIKHLPAGSLINGVDAQVWLYEWVEHNANHGLPPFPENGVFTYTQTGIPGNATSATSAYQYDFKGGPSGDPEKTITLTGDCAPPPPPVIEQCKTSTGTTLSTNLNPNGWSFAETRTSGHVDHIAGGLKVSTDGPNGVQEPKPGGGTQNADKAAGYIATNFLLKDIGEVVMNYEHISGTYPGFQLEIDKEQDGVSDGYLVGEPNAPGYGSSWWASKNDGRFGVGSGLGYADFGTLNQYLAKWPNAKITAIGFSLGSGVKGAGVIKSITVGCHTYTFDFVKKTAKFTAPTIVDRCGTANDGKPVFGEAGNGSWKIASTVTLPDDKIRYRVVYTPGTGEVVPAPGDGDEYTIVDGKAVWLLYTTNEPCPEAVFTPPTLIDECATKNDGVKYGESKDGTWKTASVTPVAGDLTRYRVVFTPNTDVVVPQPGPDDEYFIVDGKAVWLLYATNEPCEVKGNPDIKVVQGCGFIEYTFSHPATIGEDEFVAPVTFEYTDAENLVQEETLEANAEDVTVRVEFEEDSGTQVSSAGIKGEKSKSYSIETDCEPNEVTGTPGIEVVQTCGSIEFTFSYTAEIGENEFAEPHTFVYTDENGATQEVTLEANDPEVVKTVTFGEDTGDHSVSAGDKGGDLTTYIVKTDCEPNEVTGNPNYSVEQTCGSITVTLSFPATIGENEFAKPITFFITNAGQTEEFTLQANDPDVVKTYTFKEDTGTHDVTVGVKGDPSSKTTGENQTTYKVESDCKPPVKTPPTGGANAGIVGSPFTPTFTLNGGEIAALSVVAALLLALLAGVFVAPALKRRREANASADLS